MTGKELPKGYTCPNCNQEATFSSWVYAHSNVAVVHTCECGQRNLISDLKCVGTERDDDGRR